MPYFKGKDPKKLKFFCFQHISLIKFPKSREFPKDFTVLNWTICSVGPHKLLIFDIGKDLSRGDCLQRGRGEGVEQDLTWWPSPLPIHTVILSKFIYVLLKMHSGEKLSKPIYLKIQLDRQSTLGDCCIRLSVKYKPYVWSWMAITHTIGEKYYFKWICF